MLRLFHRHQTLIMSLLFLTFLLVPRVAASDASTWSLALLFDPLVGNVPIIRVDNLEPADFDELVFDQDTTGPIPPIVVLAPSTIITSNIPYTTSGIYNLQVLVKKDNITLRELNTPVWVHEPLPPSYYWSVDILTPGVIGIPPVFHVVGGIQPTDFDTLVLDQDAEGPLPEIQSVFLPLIKRK